MARRTKGFTLIEVLIALVILSVVLLGMGSYITSFSRTVSESGIRTTALDLVTDRIETVKAYGNYATLEASYSGTEPSLPGLPAFSRVTQIQHVNNATYDYKVITVSVNGPGLSSPIKKSTVISSF